MSISNMISQTIFLLSFKKTMRTMMISCIRIIFIIEMSFYITILFNFIIAVEMFKNHLEKDIMCELLNLDIEKKNYLSLLDEGQCIIRVDSIKEPFILKVPYIKRHFITVSDINRKNQLILEKSEKKLTLKIEFHQKTSNLYKRLLKNIKTSISKHISIIIPSKNKKNLNKILQNREKEDSLLLSSTNLIMVKNNEKNAVIMVKQKNYDKFDDYINKLYNEQEKNK